MAQTIKHRSWGESLSVILRPRLSWWIDLLLVAGLVGVLCGFFSLAGQARQEFHSSVEIDLSLWALPKYTLYSLLRGLIAYVISLAFTLVYGYWAAKDHVAERLLVPVLDILQSIPVLGFLPGLILGLVALFPHSNIGLELAVILAIFTAQVWNMTFSFYHSLRTVPEDMKEVSRVFRFSAWERLRWVELPFSTMGLVWNSMMGMAGGWFVLSLSEAMTLNDKQYNVPGLGSYMQAAADQGNTLAQAFGVVAMVLMIILLDQMLWRPVTVWAEKFKIEDTGSAEAQHSWFLDVLHKSGAIGWVSERWQARRDRAIVPESMANLAGLPVPVGAVAGGAPAHLPAVQRLSPVVGFRGRGPGAELEPRSRIGRPEGRSPAAAAFSMIMLLILILGMGWGIFALVQLMKLVMWHEWIMIVLAAFTTLGRVLTAVLVGTVITVPVGLAIGLSPRLSRLLQPVVQVVASFPTPMLYPVLIPALLYFHASLNWFSILLMLLGTQWYVLFNVIAGAMAVPADLREMSRSFRLTRWQRFCNLYLPGIFPYLVTGWVTAAGGAWNTSIVVEFVSFNGKNIKAFGLGSVINQAAGDGHIPLLTAALAVMSVMVVAFNMLVWRPCYHLSEKRYSLNK